MTWRKRRKISEKKDMYTILHYRVPVHLLWTKPSLHGSFGRREAGATHGMAWRGILHIYSPQTWTYASWWCVVISSMDRNRMGGGITPLGMLSCSCIIPYCLPTLSATLPSPHFPHLLPSGCLHSSVMAALCLPSHLPPPLMPVHLSIYTFPSCLSLHAHPSSHIYHCQHVLVACCITACAGLLAYASLHTNTFSTIPICVHYW